MEIKNKENDFLKDLGSGKATNKIEEVLTKCSELDFVDNKGRIELTFSDSEKTCENLYVKKVDTSMADGVLYCDKCMFIVGVRIKSANNINNKTTIEAVDNIDDEDLKELKAARSYLDDLR